MIVFDKLWTILKKRKISQYKLIHQFGVSPSQLTRLKRNDSVNTNTIEKFCKILECDICDIMELKEEGILSPQLCLNSETIPVKYNERIREIREDSSLTQQKVADLLHVGQRTYADYESGKTRIPIDSIMILAKFYDVSLDYITGASSIKSEYPKK